MPRNSGLSSTQSQAPACHFSSARLVVITMDSLSQNPNISVLQPKKKGKRTYEQKKAAKNRSNELNEGVDKIRDIVQGEIAALARRIGV